MAKDEQKPEKDKPEKPDNGGPIVEVEDQGEGFDPDRVADPLATERLGQPGGRGLLLMRTLATDLVFNRRGNHVTLDGSLIPWEDEKPEDFPGDEESYEKLGEILKEKELTLAIGVMTIERLGTGNSFDPEEFDLVTQPHHHRHVGF